MFHIKKHLIWALSPGWLSAVSAFAAPPELTAPGVIAGIARSNTYNLGATGLRGWIWVDRNNRGDTGLITDQSRQILVTQVAAPASAVLAVDDVILVAMAASSGTVADEVVVISPAEFHEPGRYSAQRVGVIFYLAGFRAPSFVVEF